MLAIRRCLLLTVTATALAIFPAGAALAGEGSEQMKLDSLVQFYEGVVFDHAMHEMVAENCATCHHHTTGDAPGRLECQGCHAAGQGAATVSCRDCHLAEPFSPGALRNIDENAQLYHTDKVGLKGAYHLSCMGCHREMSGPVGCEGCHARSEAGDEFFHAGEYAPSPARAGASGH